MVLLFLMIMIFCYLLAAGAIYIACMLAGITFHWLMPFGVLAIVIAIKSIFDR